MKDEQKALFTEEIQTEAALRYGLDESSLKSLDGFENMVYDAARDDRPYILRMSHSGHRTVNEVHSELAWLEFLARKGAAVCAPLRSKKDQLIEVIDIDDAKLIAVVFEKAEGGLVRRDDWTRAMTFNRGKLIGRMHALTKKYQPVSEQVRRHRWYEERDFADFRKYLSAEDDTVAARFDELIQTLRAYPTDIDSFGLIHMDAHHGNMFFVEDEPTLFDFDDCAYDFFVSDIAISLFYSILMLPADQDYEAYASDFLTNFMEGYRTENSLDNRWRELIPMILKRREIILYVAIHRGFDINNLDEWCTRYMAGRRERIENRVPVIDLDWNQFNLAG